MEHPNPLEWTPLPDFAVPAAGRGVTLKVAGRDVALFHADGRWWAIDDSCPHAGASLGRGPVEGCVVKCPAHGMRFDLRSGQMPGVPGFGVQAYAVEAREGRLWIRLGAP